MPVRCDQNELAVFLIDVADLANTFGAEKAEIGFLQKIHANFLQSDANGQYANTCAL